RSLSTRRSSDLNEIINSGLQKAKCRSGPLHINGDCVEKVHTFKVLGAHLTLTITNITQEKQPRVLSDGGLLPHHYRKCTDLLHLGVVLRLHCSRQESHPKGHQHSTKNHWLLTALPGIHCPLPLRYAEHT